MDLNADEIEDTTNRFMGWGPGEKFSDGRTTHAVDKAETLRLDATFPRCVFPLHRIEFFFEAHRPWIKFLTCLQAAIIDPEQPSRIYKVLLVENRNIMMFARFAHGIFLWLRVDSAQMALADSIFRKWARRG